MGQGRGEGVFTGLRRGRGFTGAGGGGILLFGMGDKVFIEWVTGLKKGYGAGRSFREGVGRGRGIGFEGGVEGGELPTHFSEALSWRWSE